MNNEEQMNLLKQILTLIGGLAIGAGVLSTAQVSALISDLMIVGAAIGAVVSAYSILWSVYAHWNMKKVPEHSTAVALPGGPALVGSINTITAQVVGTLLIGFLVLSFVAPAMAQTKKPAAPAATKLTSAQVQQNPLVLLQQFSAADLTAALADANAQTPPDITSAQCYTALLALVNSPINNPLPAGPGVFQLLQKGRDLQSYITNLQSPTGPLSQLNLACAPLMMNVNATLLALGVQTGLVLGTGGIALPALPALGGLLALL